VVRAHAGPDLKPEVLVKQAIALEQQGDWAAARLNYLAALERKPKYAEAMFRLGKLYLEHDSLSAAVVQLEAAKAKRYNQFLVDRYLARAYYELGRFSSAVELYRMLAEQKPKQADIRLELARVLYANDQLDEAHEQVMAALQLEAKNLAARMLLGRIHSRRRDFELARDEYRRLLALDPTYAEAYAALAELCKSNQIDSAIHYYRQYLGLRPDDANANFALSGLYYNLSQTDTARNVPPAPTADTAALRLWQQERAAQTLALRAAHSESAFVYVGKAISLGFSREDVYDFYVKVAIAARKRHASVIALQTFIERNPEDAQKLALLGAVLADSGDVVGAISSYKQAAAIDSAMRRRAFAWIAQQYYRQKQYDSAIAYYSQVIQIDPKAASAYLSRGYAYLQKQARTQGIADLEKGLELDPKKIEPRVYLMTLLYQDKEYNRAYEHARSVLELDPNNETARTVKKNIELMRAPKPKPEDEE
ncbi:MAG: tetratricopeptide repeat protein, partial [candidate division WOR-3 bacterium]